MGDADTGGEAGAAESIGVPALPGPVMVPPAGLGPSPGLSPSPGIGSPEVYVPEAFRARLAESSARIHEALEAATPDIVAPELTSAPPAPAAAPPSPTAAAPSPAAAAPSPAAAPPSPEPTSAPPAPAAAPPSPEPTSAPPAAAPQPAPAASPEPAAPAAPAVAAPAPAAPEPAADPPQAAAAGGSRRWSVGSVFGIGVGGLAAVLIIGGVVTGVTARSGDREETGPTEETLTASGTVERFLGAVADGDARAALDFTGETTSAYAGAEPLLTDAALRRSRELAPISDIGVDEPEGDEYQSVVTARFELGGTPVTREFSLWRVSGDWQISDPFLTVDLSRFDGLDPRVNGIDAGAAEAEVFPGAYELELGNDAFAIASSDPSLELPDDGVFPMIDFDDAELLAWAEPALTESSVEQYRSLLSEAISACIAMPDLVTPCGFDVSGPYDDGAMPVDGSVRRTLLPEGAETIGSVDPQRDYPSATRYTSYQYVSVNTWVEADLDGERVSGDLVSSGELLTPYVDFADDRPALHWE